MKLITHNMLTSNIIKGVTKGYPLAIESTVVEEVEVDYDRDFVIRMLPKIDYDVLYQAACQINYLGSLPKVMESEDDYSEEFLLEVHRILFKVEVKEGFLICPETGRKFPINNGIPNMLLTEEEV